MEEIVIPNYENYSINNLGQVKNLKTKKVLKHRIDSSGYYYVTLYKNGNSKNFRIHKLLAKLFLDVNGTIDHIDCDRKNNNINNLRSATLSQNSSNRKNTKGYYIKLRENKDGQIKKYYQAQIIKNHKYYSFCSHNLYKVLLWRCCKEIELFREFANKVKKVSVRILNDD